MGLSRSQFAEAIRVPVDLVNELTAGQRSITPDLALRLALFFDVPVEWWLIEQARYDAQQITPPEDLATIVKPYKGLQDVLVTPHGITHLEPPADVSPEPMKVTFSEAFLERLRAQVELAENESTPRTIVETTLSDGTPTLMGK